MGKKPTKAQLADQPVEIKEKPLIWMGSSKKDLLDLPLEVKQGFGFALHLAQHGLKHENAKPLKGYKGAGVLEVVEDFDGDTFRAVYTVKLEDAVYVLHCFQKKSHEGIKTPQEDIDLIDLRLKAAIDDYEKKKKKSKKRE